MFATLDGIGLDADETQQTYHRRADSLAQHLGVVEDLLRRRRKGLENGHGNARVTSGCIDDDIGGIAKLLNPLAVLAPIPQTFLPQIGLLCCVVRRREAFLASIVLIDPRCEIFPAELRKVQHQIGEITFRIDDQGGDPIDRGFFEQTDTETGLPAAGHPDADGVRDQILGVVEQPAWFRLFRGQIVWSTEIEHTEFLKILGHSGRLSRFCRLGDALHLPA